MTAVERADIRPRIAFTMDLDGFGAVDADVADHLRAALGKLEGSGATIEEACPDISGLEDTYHTLRGMMWATDARVMPPAVRETFKATLEENTRFGEALTIDDITQAQINRSRIYAEMVAFFDTYDALALPVVGCMPHPQSEEWVREIGGQTLPGYMDWLRFAFLATVASLPAISVPVGRGPQGLPVGMQLIGKPRGEAGLLQIARFVELCFGGPLGPIDPVTPA